MTNLEGLQNILYDCELQSRIKSKDRSISSSCWLIGKRRYNLSGNTTEYTVKGVDDLPNIAFVIVIKKPHFWSVIDIKFTYKERNIYLT